jgi:hypothetical protein
MAGGASLGTKDSERWGSVGEERSQSDKKALEGVGLGCNKRRAVWSLNISFVIFKHCNVFLVKNINFLKF